ncbi:hypothetical protein F5Y04DRAFT_282932 [Hypomontagnella monticulosa]|nr:hypothetical protein F5Y04DRAFT_282932 [Hypomontagnella monticulosa]
MKVISFLLSSFSVGAAVGSALPVDAPVTVGLPEGYKAVNLTWSGNVTADGPEVFFTAPSFRDIDAQIHMAYPGFIWPSIDATNSTFNSTSEVMKEKDWMTCDPNGIWWARSLRISQGIDYLRGKTGRCHMQAGPRVCSRISCSYQSAIWWCNDNDHDITIDCAQWSDYAQDILNGCQDNGQVKGQEFARESWNILVGLDTDC